MKLCIISLQVDTQVIYRSDQKFLKIDRLEQSLKKVGFRGDFIAWRGEYPPECPGHFESPMGFKAYAMQHARAKGYDLALWLDSSAVAIRPLDLIFQQIAEMGWVFFRNENFCLGEWCSDEVLAHFGIERNCAMQRPELLSGAIGLNFQNSKANQFLDSWVALARDGFAFRGTKEPISDLCRFEAIKWNKDQLISKDKRVKGHRHDQTVAGILSLEIGMDLSEPLVAVKYPDAYYNRNAAVLFEREAVTTFRRIRFRLGITERFKAYCRDVLGLLHLRKNPRNLHY
jgi:hypothetical protein